MRSKAWIKDRNFVFAPGDIVKLVRKKENGHPRALKLGESYSVVKVENDDLYLKNQRSPESSDFSIIKVNKNYFVPLERMRDELINELLNKL